MKLPTKNYVSYHYLNQEKNTAVLILPGGGYAFTSDREATPVAKFFNNLGYHSIVYHYRETKLTYPKIFEETLFVCETILKDLKVKDLIIIGFSAGGHLASYMLTKHKELFKAGILSYPVISSDKTIWHEDSFRRLLDNDMTSMRLKAVSSDLLVSDNMPPIFIWHTMDDTAVPVENSLNFFKQLVSHKNKATAHFFPKGAHGLSLVTEDTAFDSNQKTSFVETYKDVALWTKLLENWLLTL